MADRNQRSGGTNGPSGETGPEAEAGETAGRDGGSDNHGAADAPAISSPAQDEAGTLVSLELGGDADELPSPHELAGPPPLTRSRRGGARPGAGRKPSQKSATVAPAPKAPAAPKSSSRKDAPDPEAARALLTLAEGGLQLAVGERAKMSATERMFIEPPLGRLMGRLNERSAARVSALTDPLMLGIGLLMYGMRLFGAAPAAPTAPSRPNPAPNPSQPPTTPPRAPVAQNGTLGDDDDLSHYLGGKL